MKPDHLRATLAAMLIAVLGACSAPAAEPARIVRVAAASDLTFALDSIIETLEREEAGLDVRVTYGSSGQFVQQIRNGAPFDLYLSADRAYVDGLVADGLAAEPFDYAVGRLVVWYPATVAPAAPAKDPLTALADSSIRTVSIANPDHAPYGRAALAALESAGVLESVRPRLVLGENVAQAAEFARTGNADAAIIALSLVLSDPLRGIGTHVEVPLDSYPRLDQSGAILAGPRDAEAARVVRDAVIGDAGRAVLREYGFFLPEDGGR